MIKKCFRRHVTIIQEVLTFNGHKNFEFQRMGKTRVTFFNSLYKNCPAFVYILKIKLNHEIDINRLF